MTLIPHRFLFRFEYPCAYWPNLPFQDDEWIDLPATCRIDEFTALDGVPRFADVRLAWNETGLAVQLRVTGKDAPPVGDVARPRASDGLTMWLDTRADRTGHRATRYCHQFHFLAAGGGDDKTEPSFVPSRIARALHEPPLAPTDAVPLRCQPLRGGYRLDAFLPAGVLNGFDPEQHPRLGFYYAVRDLEHGEQTLSLTSDFPFAEDPSLWATLRLDRAGGSPESRKGEPTA